MLSSIIYYEKEEELKIHILDMFIIYCFNYQQSPRIYHTTLVVIEIYLNWEYDPLGGNMINMINITDFYENLK